MLQIVLQEKDGLSVALQPQSHVGLHAGHASVGNLAEVLPLGDIGDVHLHRGQVHRLQRVQNRHTGVGIGGGIDYNAVGSPQSRLNPVHNGPLVVGLEYLHLHPLLGTGLLHQGHQGGVVLFPIEVRLPDPQQIQVGAVNH